MKEKVFEFLKENNIPYDLREHKPVYTMEEMQEEGLDKVGDICKNLFLRDAKGKRHFLVCALEDTTVSLKDLGDKLGTKLSFASEERLSKYLGLTKGTVSIFGLLNDKEHAVELILDKKLQGKNKIGFHPNDNTNTLWISWDDLKKILKILDVEYSMI